MMRISYSGSTIHKTHFRIHRVERTFKTCFKPYKTLRGLLVHPKDRIPKEEQTGVVYQISCHTCREYIGETGRTIEHRVNEHKRGTE